MRNVNTIIIINQTKNVTEQIKKSNFDRIQTIYMENDKKYIASYTIILQKFVSFYIWSYLKCDAFSPIYLVIMLVQIKYNGKNEAFLMNTILKILYK